MNEQAGPVATVKRLNLFERYLSLWVAACMIVGILIGKVLPGVTAVLRSLEFGEGSQINIPIAVLIWLLLALGLGYSRFLKETLTEWDSRSVSSEAR